MNERFILGTVQFGLDYGINNNQGKPGKEKVFDILNNAYSNGILQLDTADAYGNAQIVIGEFMHSANKNFDVNTKFHVDTGVSIPDQLDRTLSQLKCSSVNVYFFHRFSDLGYGSQTISVLQDLKKKGKIKKTGVSVYTNKEFEICIDNDAVDVIQLPFNLLDNYTKRGELIREAKKKGKILQARSVFMQGLFFKEEISYPPDLQPLMHYVKTLKRIAAEYGISMFDLALGYVLSRREIDQVIIGVDSTEQLKENLSVRMDAFQETLIAEIDKIEVVEEALLYPYNWK